MADASIVERLRGERIVTGAARPFPMDDPERVYLVEQGHLDVFAVELDGDEPVSRRRFVTRVPTGSMAFGSDRAADPARPERVFGLLAVPSLDAVLLAGERAGVGTADTFDLAATTWIDDWIAGLSEFLVRNRHPVPLDAARLEADPDVRYPPGAVLSAQHGDVVWVRADAPMRLVGHRDMVVDRGEPLLPVTGRTWFELDVETEVTAVYTPTALLTGRLWPAFLRFGVPRSRVRDSRRGGSRNRAGLPPPPRARGQAVVGGQGPRWPGRGARAAPRRACSRRRPAAAAGGGRSGRPFVRRVRRSGTTRRAGPRGGRIRGRRRRGAARPPERDTHAADKARSRLVEAGRPLLCRLHRIG